MTGATYEDRCVLEDECLRDGRRLFLFLPDALKEDLCFTNQFGDDLMSGAGCEGAHADGHYVDEDIKGPADWSGNGWGFGWIAGARPGTPGK